MLMTGMGPHLDQTLVLAGLPRRDFQSFAFHVALVARPNNTKFVISDQMTCAGRVHDATS